MIDKSGPNAKVRRAYENIHHLDTLISAFAADTYSVDMKPDWWEEPSPPAMGNIIIYADAIRTPPSDDWGPIIGDIINGFRSALDHLIWSLSIDYSGAAPPDPIPRRSDWRRIAFPVRTTKWFSVPEGLWAIDPALIARIEALQPYATGQNAPDDEPLAVLDELWSIDKHRHLHLVNATVELHDVLIDIPVPGAADLPFEVISQRPPGPFIVRTEVARVRLIGRVGGIEDMNLAQMYMNPRVAVDVAFDNGSPAQGGVILHTLRKLGKTVESIIAMF